MTVKLKGQNSLVLNEDALCEIVQAYLVSETYGKTTRITDVTSTLVQGTTRFYFSITTDADPNAIALKVKETTE